MNELMNAIITNGMINEWTHECNYNERNDKWM